ncbi:MAG: hypothetical protein RL308_1789 [Bacteroidota bacterium]|jgi:hypothetical protein
MATNQFSPQDNLPNENELKNLVENFQYKKLEVHQLPIEITSNGLTNKFNSVIVAASGSTSGMLYSVVGLRPDKGGVIDEHPFVYYYDFEDSTKNFGGIIHHGDWDQRTYPLEQWQIDAMVASGLTASFTYKSIPPGSSGSLEELKANGMLDGLSNQFETLFNNQEKK